VNEAVENLQAFVELLLDWAVQAPDMDYLDNSAKTLEKLLV